MIFQKLVANKVFYDLGEICRCRTIHRQHHPEIEFFYCLDGNYSMRINERRYDLTAGDLLIIGSMNLHESIPTEGENRTVSLRAGPFFLAEYFDPIEQIAYNNPILKLSPTSNPSLYRLLEELIQVKTEKGPVSELSVKGLFYQFCGELILQLRPNFSPTKKRDTAPIEPALKLIYYHYKEPLSLELAAEQCGYSISSFCRTFRQVTGETFQQLLSRHRIEAACALLKKTDLSIEEIAAEVGFAETKSFCRVFKTVTGITAGQFRRKEP